MARIISSFDPVERFIVGTVGEPGERTFFLQARTGARLTSVLVEKAQVFALSERINFLLRELKRNDPTLRVEVLPRDDAPLEQPILEDFRVGVIGLTWLNDRNLLSIELQALIESDQESEEIALDDSEDAPDLLRVVLSPEQAQAFSARALVVVNAGRPACPFCGLALDPRGHVCPRANGYRR
ncbi:MAG TPA: DUF3090 family protein [Candidatus Nanopelagicaceae bacterium]